MAELVARLGVQREENYLYFIDSDGDVGRARSAKEGERYGGVPEKVVRLGIKKERGYLYFLDRNGDVPVSESTSDELQSALVARLISCGRRRGM